MDGNGRWAQLRGEPREAGHKAGQRAPCAGSSALSRRLGLDGAHALRVQRAELGAARRARSTRSWGCSREFLVSERDEILDNGIRLVAIGDLEPPAAGFVREVLDPLRSASSDNAQDDARARALLRRSRGDRRRGARARGGGVASGKLDPDDDRRAQRSRARLPSLGVGDPDLIIRTGGEQRISNFLLYGAAYAELAFADVLWPDFAEADLFEAHRELPAARAALRPRRTEPR